MTIFRLIAPDWLIAKHPGLPRVLEGQFSGKELLNYNNRGYNAYYLPNHPIYYVKGSTVDGSSIDAFNFVFVDFDLKSSPGTSKEDFIAKLGEIAPPPSQIVDSGNGVHVYWRVTDLDAKSYLRLCRRLMRLLNTDPAVGQIYQLMRYPGTWNTKKEGQKIRCETIYESTVVYTCEELDRILPPVTPADEAYCEQHYARTHAKDSLNQTIDETLPPKFGKLLRENQEVKALWADEADDRSKNDYRLGHIMFGNGFTKEEASRVLVNSAKAMARAPVHRLSYAENIINKIWTYELEPEILSADLSESIADILERPQTSIKGTPFRCHPRIDNTKHGFRLGQVIGLVAGSGVGKTAFALNMFQWFIQQNPDYHHFFVPLEQPGNEIADRWSTMCGADKSMDKKVHVLSNYDQDGNFRHLSLDEIKDYLKAWKEKTGNKIGCVVIDHIGALKKLSAKDERQDLMTICHKMKAFAIETDTLLVMQSQSTREKAGIGDLELNKDAAYGTIFFESYCDYLITLWQPLKRCHDQERCPTVTAFKFCKIRHKKAKEDLIKEDVPYYLYFDSGKELLRDMTQEEKIAFDFFLRQATNKRKSDRKTDIVTYQSVPYKGEAPSVTITDSDQHARRH